VPRARDQVVLPAIESAAGIAPSMKAVTAALANGVITSNEAETIARIVDLFVRRSKPATSLSSEYARGPIADEATDGRIQLPREVCCKFAV
jgi:hypothetical protein